MNESGQEFSAENEGVRPRFRAVADDVPPPVSIARPVLTYADAPPPVFVPVAAQDAQTPEPEWLPFLAGPKPPPPLNAPIMEAPRVSYPYAVPAMTLSPAPEAVEPAEEVPWAVTDGYPDSFPPSPFLTAPAPPPLVGEPTVTGAPVVPEVLMAPPPGAQSFPLPAPLPTPAPAVAVDIVDEFDDSASGLWSIDDDDSSQQAALSGADRELVAALQEVLRFGASDLHVTVNAPPMIRVDGGLRPLADSVVWDRSRVSKALRSILSQDQREIFEHELELDFAYTISSNARFRVNIYQQRGSMGAAFRLIPTEIKPLADLGVPDAVAHFATLARGLVLVTGPTGSGKSTTLAALVDLVNRTRADHIVTVEDPIEFLHQNHRSLVNQREVGPDTHSFANALKHVLRQDPDVILIGELRDLETISVALTAAETGHLVFATLHTQDAAQTIDRVIDVFPPHQQGQVRSQLAAVLQGVVCQTLVKRASGKGRVVATEVLVTTPAVANLIREGKTYQIPSALQAGRDLGMYTMDQHLAELVDEGRITHLAAMEKAHDTEGLKRLIHRVDPGAGTPGSIMSTAAGVDFGDFGYNGGAH